MNAFFRRVPAYSVLYPCEARSRRSRWRRQSLISIVYRLWRVHDRLRIECDQDGAGLGRGVVPCSFQHGGMGRAAVGVSGREQVSDKVELTFEYVIWAIALGAISAVSLPLGSLVGIKSNPHRYVNMRMQGFSKTRVFLLWFSLLVITAIGAGVGFLLADSVSHSFVVFAEGLAAGVMLTMIAGAMIPEAIHMGRATVVGLSTLSGFLAAISFKLMG